MKRLFAALMLTACVAQTEDRFTLEVDNQSDRAMVHLSIWEVLPDGTLVDDRLGGINNPMPGHAIPVLELAITRCFEHLRVNVEYDDGHKASQDVNLCQDQSIAFNYYP